MLDIVAAPDFATSNLVFFSFSEPGKGGAGTAVARAKLVRDGGSARLDDVEVIFSMAKKTNVTRHFGSRLVFAPDGTLFVTTGDRGERNRAQDMQDHAGSIIRINTDGSIPADNPSPDGARHLPEIWSKGHRNAQGATWDPVLGGLLTVEHGDKGGDEVNQPAGRQELRLAGDQLRRHLCRQEDRRRHAKLRATSSRCSTGIRRSRRPASPAIRARCSRNGRATSSSVR